MCVSSVSPAPTDPDALPSNVLYTYSYPDKGNEFALTVKRYNILMIVHYMI